MTACDKLQVTFARFGSRLEWDSLPLAVRKISGMLLTDTLATMMAGSAAEGIDIVLAQIREWGGREQSRVAVFGDRVPAPLAALANALMVHALDYDDTLDSTKLHANVCIVPALLATAEAYGPVHGKDLVAAHAAGLEVACRLSLAANEGIAPGWLPTTVFGCFGAVVAAGRVLRLDETQLSHAMGIVYTQAGGNRQGLVDGALTKRLQPALYAQAAVTAALLARRGITGASAAFQGPYGLYPLLVGSKGNPSRALDRLEEDYELLQIGVKPYPCCRLIHQAVDATFDILSQADFHAEDVHAIEVKVPDDATLSFVGQPFEVRRNPQVDAQFSIAYCVAACILHRALGLSQFVDDAILSHEAASLAARVSVAVNPGLDGQVTVDLNDGRCLKARAMLPTGHPGRPLGAEALRNKFHDCAAHAARALPSPQLQALLATLDSLEQTPDSGCLLEQTIPQEQ